MSVYDEMRTVAAELFEEFKQGEVRYVSVTSTGGTSPDEPTSTTETTSEPLNATARPVSTKYVDNSHIVQFDKQATIPNDGKATPAMSGSLLIDGVKHKIIEIMPRPAAGTPITWTVIVRR